jgi:hypothetical protein
MLKKINIDDIELGNLLFGHSRGKYLIPREEWTETFHNFLEDCGFDFYGRVDADELEKNLVTKYDVEYLYGETLTPDELYSVLTKGTLYKKTDFGDLKKLDGQLYSVYEVPGKEYQEAYDDWDEKFDIYNNALEDYIRLNNLDDDFFENAGSIIPEEIKALDPGDSPDPANFKKVIEGSRVEEHQIHTHYFDNGVFMVIPYQWNDGEELTKMPNFKYYPEDIEISWYKYSLRDAYINKDISLDEFKVILQKCKKSL